MPPASFPVISTQRRHFTRCSLRLLPWTLLANTLLSLLLTGVLWSWSRPGLAFVLCQLYGCAIYLCLLPAMYAHCSYRPIVVRVLLLLLGVPLGIVLGHFAVMLSIGYDSFAGYTDSAPPSALVIGVSMLGFALIYFDGRWRLEEQRRHTERIERALIEARLRTMQTQIEPCFVSRVLRSVGALLEASPLQAKALLAHLNDYLRASLLLGRGHAGALGTEFSRLYAYVHLLIAQMGSPCRLHLDCPADCETLSLPPMLLQPTVEQILNMGILTTGESPQGCEMALSARRQSDMLELSLRWTRQASDPFDLAALEQGLVPVRERLDELFGQRAALHIEVDQRPDMQIRLRIPIEEQLILRDPPKGVSPTAWRAPESPQPHASAP